jgi:hypothetical protein
MEEHFPVLINLRTRCVRGFGHSHKLSLQMQAEVDCYKVYVENWGNYVEKWGPGVA